MAQGKVGVSLVPVTTGSQRHPTSLLSVIFGVSRQGREELLDQKGNDEQGHDVDDFNHRVDRRTGRILKRIADRITGYRRFVGFRPFESLFLNGFLGIIPSSAPTGHHNR